MIIAIAPLAAKDHLTRRDAAAIFSHRKDARASDYYARHNLRAVVRPLGSG
jgi:hypothetical protein